MPEWSSDGVAAENLMERADDPDLSDSERMRSLVRAVVHALLCISDEIHDLRDSLEEDD